MKKIITFILFSSLCTQGFSQSEPKTLIQRTLDAVSKENEEVVSNDTVSNSQLMKSFTDRINDASTESGLSTLTGFNWQATVINGVTDFLKQRAKDEVLASLLGDLKVFFVESEGKCQSLNPEIIKVLKASFPNIAGLVNNTVVYDKNVLMMLQKALTEDLNNEVPKQAAQLVDQYLERRKVESDQRILSTYILERIFAMLNGSNPYLVLAQMKDNLPAISNGEMKSCLFILSVLASEQYYLSSTENLELNTAVTDLSTFLSFQPIYEKFRQLLEEELKNNKKILPINLSRYAILELAQGLKTLGDDIQNLRDKTDSAYRLGYIKFLNSLLNLVKGLENFDAGLSSKWEKSLIGVKKIVELQQSILAKDYRKSILLFTNILDSSILDSKTVRFLSFAATMAEVKSSKEVVAAIESFASPIGSFRTKRIDEKPRAYATINAYLGYAAGREWLIDKTIPNSRLASGYHGYYTPVGFEFGTATKSKVVSSIGLFISPVDLGTMTSYRIGNNSWDSLKVNNQEKINFRSVLAPSAALVFGLSKTKPVTFAVGYQFSPEQRVLTNTVLNTNTNLNVHRFFASLTIDLTLLRL